MSIKITKYRHLLEILQDLNDEWLDSNISIEIDDEFYSGVNDIYYDESSEDDILDEGHPIIRVEF